MVTRITIGRSTPAAIETAMNLLFAGTRIFFYGEDTYLFSEECVERVQAFHAHRDSEERLKASSCDCTKFFDKILSLVDYEEGEVQCPHCGSKNVEQRWSAISAITSKKSA